MKRIGKGDYAWSTNRDDLPEKARNMTEQVKGYLETDELPLMSAGIAKLAARCGLDYLYTQERARIPMPTDYHLDEDGKPRCRRQDASRNNLTLQTQDRRLSCPQCLDLAREDTN